MINRIVFNAESVFYYIVDSNYRSYVDYSDSLLCDSFSLSLILKIRGTKHKRLHGPDYMDFLLKNFPDEKYFVIGGSKRSHQALENIYQLSDVKFDHSVIDPSELHDLKIKICDAKPHYIIVCLGLYKQEMVMFDVTKFFRDEPLFDDCIITGCGAAIDFLSGTKHRSGTLWQKLGLEWLPRLCREPRMGIRVVRSLLGCIMLLFASNKILRRIDKFEVSFDE